MRFILTKSQGGRLVLVAAALAFSSVSLGGCAVFRMLFTNASLMSGSTIVFSLCLVLAACSAIIVVAHPFEAVADQETLLLRFIHGTRRIRRNDVVAVHNYLLNPTRAGESTDLLVVVTSSRLALGRCALLLRGTRKRNNPAAAITGSDYATELDAFLLSDQH